MVIRPELRSRLTVAVPAGIGSKVATAITIAAVVVGVAMEVGELAQPAIAMSVVAPARRRTTGCIASAGPRFTPRDLWPHQEYSSATPLERLLDFSVQPTTYTLYT